MRRLILGLAAAGLLTAAASTSVAAEAAASPNEIRPLLIGDKLPELVLQNGDGAEFDLNAAVASQPTVLIVYRGGW